ncbi:hypothetical protein NDU88_002036 [Pleurodeles waltl]|uniref:Uncharacterized protein n=1 Tax=Pleurodeles waltl TaxID=8319 RepID=A0AAV7WK43_PLEWA|nr:hypothetical protein NDU88_002036 [Pleurodeles waltl]
MRVGLPYLVVAPPTAHPATDQGPLGTRPDASKAEKSDWLTSRAVMDWLTNATPTACLNAVRLVLIPEAARGESANAFANNRHRHQTHTACAPERAAPHHEGGARTSPSAAAQQTLRLRWPATAGIKHALALSSEKRTSPRTCACGSVRAQVLHSTESRLQHPEPARKKKRENKM